MKRTITDRPLVFAHRGARQVAPENTIPAFEAAIRLGADGIELDVQYSSDGKLVIIHDLELGSTTSGTGRVQRADLRGTARPGCRLPFRPGVCRDADSFSGRGAGDVEGQAAGEYRAKIARHYRRGAGGRRGGNGSPPRHDRRRRHQLVQSVCPAPVEGRGAGDRARPAALERHGRLDAVGSDAETLASRRLAPRTADDDPEVRRNGARAARCPCGCGP